MKYEFPFDESYQSAFRMLKATWMSALPLKLNAQGVQSECQLPPLRMKWSGLVVQIPSCYEDPSVILVEDTARSVDVDLAVVPKENESVKVTDRLSCFSLLFLLCFIMSDQTPACNGVFCQFSCCR